MFVHESIQYHPTLCTRQDSKTRYATRSAGVNFLSEKGCALEKDYKQWKLSVDGKSGHTQSHKNRCKLCRED